MLLLMAIMVVTPLVKMMGVLRGFLKDYWMAGVDDGTDDGETDGAVNK